MAHTWEEAVAKGAELATRMGADAVAVAGGAEIYALALPHVQSIFLTRFRPHPRAMPSFRTSTGHSSARSRREDHPKGPR